MVILAYRERWPLPAGNVWAKARIGCSRQISSPSKFHAAGSKSFSVHLRQLVQTQSTRTSGSCKMASRRSWAQFSTSESSKRCKLPCRKPAAAARMLGIWKNHTVCPCRLYERTRRGAFRIQRPATLQQSVLPHLSTVWLLSLNTHNRAACCLHPNHQCPTPAIFAMADK